MLVSWDKIFDNKIAPEAILTKLSDLTNRYNYNTPNCSDNVVCGNSYSYTMVLINNQCNPTITNSYIGDIHTRMEGNQNLFRNICETRLPSDFKIGKYNLLFQSYCE